MISSRLQPAKRWNLQPAASPSFLQSIAEHPLLLQVLWNRGLRSEGEVRQFLLRADAVRENPYRLRDMQTAVQRILRALQKQETICVYGDFDADGVSSTVLLVLALHAAGGRVGPYIPDRFDEGYGLNLGAIERIAHQAKLLITVDCGIRSVVEVQHAIDLGMDVIVTDHHTVGAELPPALAVINPRRADCPSKFDRLAGVGVAYRLAQAVLRATAQKKNSKLTVEQAAEIEEELLDLVALGTVADVMPLLGENRSLVWRGLTQLRRTARPGLVELMRQAKLSADAVDTTAISFRLAPRINAAGRLEHAKLAYELLRTADPTRAYLLASELEILNQRRQNLTAEAQAEAEAQVAEQMAANPALYVVQSPNFKPGIVGLVAGKLTERLYRPAVVIEQAEYESRGSARSIPEFDISAALDSVKHFLVRYGGHTRAAGFTVRTEQIPAFSQALTELAARSFSQLQEELQPTLTVDAEVTLEQLNWGVLEHFARLEPTGQENPAPVLYARHVRVREARRIGGDKHIKFMVDQGGKEAAFDAVAFHQGERTLYLPNDVRIDIVFQLAANEWQGRRQLQLNIIDMAAPQQ